MKGDKPGHWLASWLAGRPGMPLSGCWLANRSPAELSWYLCNRPATSRLISNQPATGQPPGSNGWKDLISCIWAGSGWQSAGQSLRQEVTGNIVGVQVDRKGDVAESRPVQACTRPRQRGCPAQPKRLGAATAIALQVRQWL